MPQLCTPHLALSNNHLFRSMQSSLDGPNFFVKWTDAKITSYNVAQLGNFTVIGLCCYQKNDRRSSIKMA